MQSLPAWLAHLLGRWGPEAEELGPRFPHLFREGLEVVSKDPPSSVMLGSLAHAASQRPGFTSCRCHGVLVGLETRYLTSLGLCAHLYDVSWYCLPPRAGGMRSPDNKQAG